MVDVSETWPLSLLKRTPEAKQGVKTYGSTGTAAGKADGDAEAPEGGTPRQDVSMLDSFVRALPKTVDTLLAALGLAASLSVLMIAGPASGFRLYSLSMAASGIIFFAPGSPPQVQGFLLGTAVGTFISWVRLPRHLPHPAAPPAAPAPGATAGRRARGRASGLCLGGGADGGFSILLREEGRDVSD